MMEPIAHAENNTKRNLTRRILEIYDTRRTTKISGKLREFVEEYNEADENTRHLMTFDIPSSMLMSASGLAYVEVTSVNDDASRLITIAERTDGIENMGCFKNTCSFRMHISLIEQLSKEEEVQVVSPNLVQMQGAIDSRASVSMRADLGREQFSVSGAGLKVCSLSDSFNFTGVADIDIEAGELPPLEEIEIVRDLLPQDNDNEAIGIDEGRALMHLIHDVAPGATLAFETATIGSSAMAFSIRNLAANRNCDIIVDDVLYLAEPQYEDGFIATSVNAVVREGTTYLSSAGNNGRDSAWEGNFVQSPNGNFHLFDEDRIFIRLRVETNSTPILLFWSDPYSRTEVKTNLDLFAFTAGTENIIASGIDDNMQSGIPVEAIFLDEGEYDLYINIVFGDVPELVKIQCFGTVESVLGPILDAPTLYGHAQADGNIAVGASYFFETPALGVNPAIHRDYSSTGGTPILFDDDNQRLEEVEIRDKPTLVGPDGVCTSFFFSLQFGDLGPTCPFVFRGTSAAAPNVAAVAALLLELDPTLTPNDIRRVLQDTAGDMDDLDTPDFDSGFDFRTGYGFVDARKALVKVSADAASRQRDRRSSSGKRNTSSKRGKRDSSTRSRDKRDSSSSSSIKSRKRRSRRSQDSDKGKRSSSKGKRGKR